MLLNLTLIKFDSMRKLAVLTLFALAFSSCKDDFPENGCIEVSLVTEICGNAVLKIIDPAYQHLGESWNDHHNVFLTSFNCEDMGSEKEGTFYVKFLEEYKSGDCAVCLAMIDYQGDKKYPVKIVGVCDVEMAD